MILLGGAMGSSVKDENLSLPPWLEHPEEYTPSVDKDAFLTKSFLQLASVLSQLRFDDGKSGMLSPSALIKVLVTLAWILMVSLSRNYVFILCILAGVLVTATLLPAFALRRVMLVSLSTACLTGLIMLPAVFMGQPHAPVLLATKVFVTVGMTMEASLTTSPGELASALRKLHVPSIVILTGELALRSIVELGMVCKETLTALRLRSVGSNTKKASSLAGVAGITLVRASQSSLATYDAMRCRCFTGEYEAMSFPTKHGADVVWIVLLTITLFLFVILQRVS